MKSIASSLRRSLTHLTLVMGLVAAFSATAAAQQLLQGTATDADSEGERSRWRGSMVFYGNNITARTLDPGADLTYNPYYAMDLTLLPRFWLSDSIYLRGILTIAQEFTNADYTTKKYETQLGDTTIGVGSSLGTIPWVDVGVSGTLDLRAPSSKWSRSQDLILAVQANANFFRTFPVLEGLSLSYSIGLVRFFHEATTGSTEDSPYGDEWGDKGASATTFVARSRPDMFINNGVRNQRVRLMHTGAISQQFLPWLSASVSVTAMHDFLHPNMEENPQDSVAKDINARDYMFYSMEVAFQPIDFVGIAVVANTSNPQLSPDPGTRYYTPFINRYTELALQARFNVGSLF